MHSAVSRKRELICRFHTLYGPSAEQHYVRTVKQRFARAAECRRLRSSRGQPKNFVNKYSAAAQARNPHDGRKKIKSLKARPKHKQQPLKFALPTDTRKITTLRACSPLQSFTARTKRKLRYRCLHAPQARIFTHIYSGDYIFKTNCDDRFYASGTKKF